MLTSYEVRWTSKYGDLLIFHLSITSNSCQWLLVFKSLTNGCPLNDAGFRELLETKNHPGRADSWHTLAADTFGGWLLCVECWVAIVKLHGLWLSVKHLFLAESLWTKSVLKSLLVYAQRIFRICCWWWWIMMGQSPQALLCLLWWIPKDCWLVLLPYLNYYKSLLTHTHTKYSCW